MTIRSHPDPSTLIAYASGTLPAAIAGAVACHLSMCPQCAEHVRLLNTVGGLLMMHSQSPPLDEKDESVSAVAAMEREPGGFSELATSAKPIAADPVLPEPLANYLGMGSADIPWKSLPKGVKQYWVKMPKGGGLMRLLKAPPRTRLLEHSHRGMELTLVLTGVYSDHTGDYRRGDVAEMHVDTDHKPASTGEEECICIVASEFMPRYSQWYARLAGPIVGF